MDPLADTPRLTQARDADAACRTLRQAAQAMLTDPLRRGSTIELPETGRLVMTGDLHDHDDNLRRILRLADLEAGPHHHVVLHEVIHASDRPAVATADFSIQMLLRVAELKLRYPSQVHVLLSNHELAQVRDEAILKGGASVVAAFNEGIDGLFEDGADAVREALRRYVYALPLAVRLPYGILCTHSLPSPRRLEAFDPGVLDRAPTEQDLAKDGSAYDLVWGRRHTQAVADELGMAWDVDLFVMGHQPAEMGHLIEGDTMIVLASDHNHGVALPIDLARPYRLFDLVQQIKPLAAVRL